MRVACRRLRSGFRVFRSLIGRERAKRWRSALRSLASVLGKARDLDVQIAAMVARLGETDQPEVRHGIVFWIAWLERARNMAQLGIRRALTRFVQRGTLREIDRCMKDLRRKAHDAQQLPPTLPDGYAARLLRRLESFVELGGSLKDETDCAGHHEFRIAAKKLRYTLEICQPLLDADFEVASHAVREMQSFLGEIHDCDVWAQNLSDAIRRMETGEKLMAGWLNQKRFLPGLEFLKTACLEKRRRLFDEVCAFWRDEKVASLWPRLASALGQSVKGESVSAAPSEKNNDAWPIVQRQPNPTIAVSDIGHDE